MEALCALITVTFDPDHAPDMSKYNVIFCLREAYFDAPDLEWLILNARSNVRALCHRTKVSVQRGPY